MTTKQQQQEKEESIVYLKTTLGIAPGDTIHTILRSVSRSGMNRKISIIYKDINISWHVAKIFQEKSVEKFGHHALSVSGCGMDMGFNCVYNLSRILFSDTLHKDSGCALKQQWL